MPRCGRCWRRLCRATVTGRSSYFRCSTRLPMPTLPKRSTPTRSSRTSSPRMSTPRRGTWVVAAGRGTRVRQAGCTGRRWKRYSAFTSAASSYSSSRASRRGGNSSRSSTATSRRPMRSSSRIETDCRAAGSSSKSMAAPPTVRSISSTTASATVLLLRCALRLLPFPRNRRKLGYSGSVDDLAVWIEAGSVARAVPRFLRTIPANHAIEVGAYRRSLVDATVVVAIDGDLTSAATDDRALTGLDGVDGGRFAGGEIVLVLFGDVGVFLDVLGCRTQADTCWIV